MADDFLYYRKVGFSWFLGEYKGFLARAYGGRMLPLRIDHPVDFYQ